MTVTLYDDQRAIGEYEDSSDEPEQLSEVETLRRELRHIKSQGRKFGVDTTALEIPYLRWIREAELELEEV